MTNNNRYPPIHLGAPGEDISKKDLHAITQRFKNLNQLRLQRVQDFLQNRQQVFLNLLPLLFHQNYALLPGYISSDTPAGIPDYIPNKNAIQAAKVFSKGFNFKRRALLSYPIISIFLMGSVSSIAFSKTSDMDIWLCHIPELSSSGLDELQQKATEIENWAVSLGLEVHFFLVNHEQFRNGHDIPISDESSGTTQHYLLLEEFYRTAIYIAGRIPAWWLVPPHQERQYSSYIRHLIKNRFIAENEMIDFGGLESMPAEEFISATLWHIYKSLNSPHKSLLKLFLMESYASEYPQPQWLCFKLKHAIYQGTFNLDSLDPYLLIYLKVEDYLLAAGSTRRLTLVRQCFYLKIMGSSSKALDYHSRSFRENYLQHIAVENNWPEDLLASFNKQKNWNIKKATEEHIIIRTQLKHSLRMIISLASNHVNYHYRDNEDLKLIARKLHTFLERKPGKIEIITTRAAVHNKEDELSIVEFTDKDQLSHWSLYAGKYDTQKTNTYTLIKKQNSILGLLAWLVINGLYKKQLQLNFYSTSLTLSKNELHQILSQLFHFLSDNLKIANASLNVYKKPDKILCTMIFVNLGKPFVNEREDGMMMISERSDPLSYGQNRLSFIQQVDRVSVSCWGEVTTLQYHGVHDYFSCLTDIYNNCQQPLSPNQFRVVCFAPIRANSIIFRTETIIENLLDFFSVDALNSRYFVAGEQFFYVFQKRNNFLNFWRLDSSEQLMQELEKTQRVFCTTHFDFGVLDNTIIPFIYTYNIERTIQLFYTTENNKVKLYILDEKGSLFIQEYGDSNYQQILTHYSIFLESILNQPCFKNDISVKYYHVQKIAEELCCSKAKWTPIPTATDLSVRLVIEDFSSTNKHLAYHVYCNDIEFNSLDYGNDLFKEISRYILDFRKNSEDYPLYISDLDVPCSQLGVETDELKQTLHYLTYKRKIELRLNANP